MRLFPSILQSSFPSPDLPSSPTARERRCPRLTIPTHDPTPFYSLLLSWILDSDTHHCPSRFNTSLQDILSPLVGRPRANKRLFGGVNSGNHDNIAPLVLRRTIPRSIAMVHSLHCRWRPQRTREWAGFRVWTTVDCHEPTRRSHLLSASAGYRFLGFKGLSACRLIPPSEDPGTRLPRGVVPSD